jgi:hypothetical protein
VVRLFARLIGDGLGIDEELVGNRLDLYLLELSQDRYRPSIVAAGRAARKARKQQAAADQTLLDKIGKYTVDDGDLPPIPDVGRGAAKRKPGRR